MSAYRGKLFLTACLALLSGPVFADPLVEVIPPGALLQLGTAQLRHPYQRSPALTVLYAPDGKTLASRSDDHTIRLWDAVTGKLVHQLADPSVQVPELLGSPLLDVRSTSALPLPPALYLDAEGRGRANSTGADLPAPAQRAPLQAALDSVRVEPVPEASAAEVDA